jgi:hypothetical protein
MNSPYTTRGSVTALEAATLFGSALFAKNKAADLIWATTSCGPIKWQGSVLKTIDWVKAHTKPEGTFLGKAVEKYYSGHDRVFLFTDGQFHDTLPKLNVPYYTFILNGYRTTPIAAGQGKDHEIGGLSDATFKVLPLIEDQKAGRWPWEV